MVFAVPNVDTAIYMNCLTRMNIKCGKIAFGVNHSALALLHFRYQHALLWAQGALCSGLCLSGS